MYQTHMVLQIELVNQRQTMLTLLLRLRSRIIGVQHQQIRRRMSPQHERKAMDQFGQAFAGEQEPKGADYRAEGR